MKDTVRIPCRMLARDAKETTVLYENSDTNISCESDSRFSAIHKHIITCPTHTSCFLCPDDLPHEPRCVLLLLSFRARFIIGILPLHAYYTLYVTNRILKILKTRVCRILAHEMLTGCPLPAAAITPSKSSPSRSSPRYLFLHTNAKAGQAHQGCHPRA